METIDQPRRTQIIHAAVSLFIFRHYLQCGRCLVLSWLFGFPSFFADNLATSIIPQWVQLICHKEDFVADSHEESTDCSHLYGGKDTNFAWIYQAKIKKSTPARAFFFYFPLIFPSKIPLFSCKTQICCVSMQHPEALPNAVLEVKYEKRQSTDYNSVNCRFGS